MANLFMLLMVFLADGIDVLQVLSRIGQGQRTEDIVALVLLMMAANYGINFLVIGWPSIKFGGVPVRIVALDLVWMTLLGQVADRLGAIIPLFLPLPILMPYVWQCSNLLLTSLLIMVLVSHFVKYRWHVNTRMAEWVVLAATILTNPTGIWMVFAYSGVLGW